MWRKLPKTYYILLYISNSVKPLQYRDHSGNVMVNWSSNNIELTLNTCTCASYAIAILTYEYLRYIKKKKTKTKKKLGDSETLLFSLL